jgi:hypothetical protein
METLFSKEILKNPLTSPTNCGIMNTVKESYSPKKQITARAFRAGCDKKKFLKQRKTP